MAMIAEGYYAANSMHHINEKYGVDMPISEAVYQILYERKSAHLEMKALTEKLS